VTEPASEAEARDPGRADRTDQRPDATGARGHVLDGAVGLAPEHSRLARLDVHAGERAPDVAVLDARDPDGTARESHAERPSRHIRPATRTGSTGRLLLAPGCGGSHAFVGHEVEDRTVLATGRDEAAPAQPGEMVRYAGDRDVEAGRDLTDRQVTLRIEELEDPESCRGRQPRP
jgi:hypothetical protein